MRTTLIFLLVAAISAICILATTPPDCLPCSEVQCRSHGVNCQCGNYTTHCGCCELCYKCAGEVCKPRLREVCEREYECNLRPSPTDDPNFDVEGTCTYIPTTRAPRPQE